MSIVYLGEKVDNTIYMSSSALKTLPHVIVKESFPSLASSKTDLSEHVTACDKQLKYFAPFCSNIFMSGTKC
jgi:hypothetical protein